MIEWIDRFPGLERFVSYHPHPLPGLLSVSSRSLLLMEAPGMRRRARPEALVEYFSSLGETEAHVLAEQARVRDAYLQMEWRELPEARQDRLLSAPFLHSLTAARAYDEADWGAAVVRCESQFNAQH